MSLRTAVVKRKFLFTLLYRGNREEKLTVEAESYNAALLQLPDKEQDPYIVVGVMELKDTRS